MNEQSITENNRRACRLRAALLAGVPALAVAAYALATGTTSPAFYVNSAFVLAGWTALALFLAAPSADEAGPADTHAFEEHARTWVTRHGYLFEKLDGGFTLAPSQWWLRLLTGKLAVGLGEPCHAELMGSTILTRLVLAHGLRSGVTSLYCKSAACDYCATRREFLSAPGAQGAEAVAGS